MQWGLLLTLCRGWSLRGSPPWGCDGPPGCQSPACQLAPIHPLCSAAHTHAFHPDYAVWAEYINKTVSRDEMKSKAIWQAYNGHVCVCRCTWVQQLHIKGVMGPDHRGEVNLLFAERQSWILLTSLPACSCCAYLTIWLLECRCSRSTCFVAYALWHNVCVQYNYQQSIMKMPHSFTCGISI